MVRLSLVLALVAGAMPASAADAEGGRRSITAHDLWAVKRLSAPAVSIDGKRAVVSVQEWSIEKNQPSASLWLVNIASGKTRRLTNGNGSSDSAPAWSQAGQRVAFVSKRGDDETAALYVTNVDGGEAEELIELPFGVASPRWLPGGRGIVFATQPKPQFDAPDAEEQSH